MATDDDGVVLYWRPLCPYCMKLRLRLLFTRLRYTSVNIWKDREAAAFVRSVADGNEMVPTVTVAGRAMVNPSKRRLFGEIRAYAPHLLPRAGPTGPRNSGRMPAASSPGLVCAPRAGRPSR